MPPVLVDRHVCVPPVGATGSLSIGEEVKWSNKGDGKSLRFAGSEVGKATWSVFGKYGTCVLMKADGSVLARLEGFSRRDQEGVSSDVGKLGVTMETLEYCSSGVNRGKHSFEDGKRLVVNQTSEKEGAAARRLFDVDLSKVSQCVLPTGVAAKGGEQKEVTMQFVESDARVGKG